jgi:hypothetical protein
MQTLPEIVSGFIAAACVGGSVVPEAFVKLVEDCTGGREDPVVCAGVTVLPEVPGDTVIVPVTGVVPGGAKGATVFSGDAVSIAIPAESDGRVSTIDIVLKSAFAR